MTDLRQFLRDTWRLAKPYWFSEDRWAAWGLLAIVVAMNLGLVYINVLLNKWQNTFFNAVQEKNAEVFFRQLWVFTGLAALFIEAWFDPRYEHDPFLSWGGGLLDLL